MNVEVMNANTIICVGVFLSYGEKIRNFPILQISKVKKAVLHLVSP